MEVKMLKKKILSVLMVTLLMVSVLYQAAGCKNILNDLDFPVPESVEADYNTMFTLPQIIAIDKDGNEYVADVIVKDKDGNVIDSIGNMFFVRINANYTAEYSVEYKSKTVKKTMEIIVGDKSKPVITVLSSKYIALLSDGTFTIPVNDITVTDNLTQNPVVTYSVFFNGTEIVVNTDLSFTLNELGDYEIKISARDEKGNIGTKSITLTVYASPDEILNFDFEDASQINMIYGYEDSNWEQVNYAIKSYSELEIPHPSMGGDYCLWYSPTKSNPGGSQETFAYFILDLGVVLKKGTTISFLYYYEKPEGYDPDSSLRLGIPDETSLHQEDEVAKFNTYGGPSTRFNFWHKLEYTLKEDMNKIEFELYSYTGLNNGTEINLYVDNIRIASAFDYAFDFEKESQLDMVYGYEEGSGVQSLYDIKSYSEIGITAPQNSGQSCLWYAPAVSNPGGWTRADLTIDFREIMPAGTAVSFLYYYQKPDSYDPDCSLKVGEVVENLGEDCEIAQFNTHGGKSFNTWHKLGLRLKSDLQVLKFEMYSYTGSGDDGTQINLYIDCIMTGESALDYDEFQFENEDELYKVYGYSNGEWVQSEYDIVSYSEIGISAPVGGGNNCLWYSPVLSSPDGGNWSRSDITIDFGKVIPAGKVLSFMYYFQIPQGYNIEASLKVGEPVNDLSTSDEVAAFKSSGKAFNEWHKLEVTLKADLSKIKFELFIVSGAYDAREINLFMDCIELSDSVQVQYNSFDFEDEAQLSVFESANIPQHDMHVGFSLVSYADIGMEAPEGCGEKLLKVVTTHGNGYMPFYIHNGFVVPQGATISFRIYKPGTKTDGFKIRYEDELVTPNYMSEGQWHDFTFTTPVASDTKFGYDIYLYIRNYDLVPGAAYYIDNFTITMPN
jgi:hypothetical protein